MTGIGKYSIIVISFLIFAVLVSCNQQKNQKDHNIKDSAKIRDENEQSKLSQYQELSPSLVKDEGFIYTTTKQYNIGEISNQKIDEIAPRNITETLSGSGSETFQFAKETKEIPKDSYRFISVTFDNDIFNNTDYYYTNGVDIRVVSPLFSINSLSRILIGSKDSDIEHFGVSIKQNIYTPTNPDVPEIIKGDRPFSAFLTLGTFRSTYNLNRLFITTSELNIGILGPASLGGNVQSSIHDIEPVGWNNQIKNSLVIDYSVDIEKGLVSSPHLEINATAGFNAGTLFNKVRGGLYLRAGSFTPVYRGPSNTYDFQYWFFVRGSTNLVLYDATLQGGLIGGENIYSISGKEINRFVINASAGLAMQYKGLGLELESFYISPEFKNAYDFRWGRIKVLFNI